MTQPDVVVAGGGIIGLGAAYELSRAGLRTLLLDRGVARAPASLASAGLVSPLFDPPFSGPLVDAGRASRDLWVDWSQALREESGLPLEHDTSGALVLAHDEREERELDAIGAAAISLGEGAEEVPLGDARRLVHDLSSHLRRVLLLANEHRVDNVQACAALAAAIRRRGVDVQGDSEFLAVERAGSGLRLSVRRGAALASLSTPLLILATGAWAGLVAGLPPLPVEPVHGQLLQLEAVPWRWRGQVRRAGRYAVRRGDSSLIAGATLERVGFETQPTPAGAATILAWLLETFPGLSAKPLSRVWSGLRPGTPDGLPLIGPLPEWPVFAATGHFRSGILLAPWTARAVARHATAGAAFSDPLLQAFRPERFIPTAPLTTVPV